MNINEFYKKINDILYQEHDDITKYEKWLLLKKEIEDSKKHPVKVSRLLNIIKDKFNENKKINILDHGCGGSYSLIYLFALGYENIYGVDIGEDPQEVNNFLSIILKKKVFRRLVYDGKNLPFQDLFFDIIFTQQVLEHVSFSHQKIFLKEENRVLKVGGIAYHQIPHKLVPYESHIKIWFLHWLPKKLFIILCKLLKKNYRFFENDLWLQFPWTIKSNLKKYIGQTKNLSNEKIGIFNNESSEFSGLSYFLRKFVSDICKIPLFGRYFSKVLSLFIMLETVSFKAKI